MANQLPGQIKWQPNPDDAIKLAALRWFALTIESSAIQIYATDARQYAALEQVLHACVDGIRGLNKDFVLGGDDDCPPGFVQCGNECAPMCLNE